MRETGMAVNCLLLRLRFPELVDELLERLHLLLVHLNKEWKQRRVVMSAQAGAQSHSAPTRGGKTDQVELQNELHAANGARYQQKVSHCTGEQLLLSSPCSCTDINEMLEARVEMRIRADRSDLLRVGAVEVCVETEQSFVDLFHLAQELARELRVLLDREEDRIRDALVRPRQEKVDVDRSADTSRLLVVDAVLPVKVRTRVERVSDNSQGSSRNPAAHDVGSIADQRYSAFPAAMVGHDCSVQNCVHVP
jgi:hypothetical protein